MSKIKTNSIVKRKGNTKTVEYGCINSPTKNRKHIWNVTVGPLKQLGNKNSPNYSLKEDQLILISDIFED